MNNLARGASAIALIVTGVAPVWASPSRPEDSRSNVAVTVRVFNYAAVPSRALAKARREAGRIFRRSGIETQWIECSILGVPAESNPRCIAKTEPTDIVVRVVSEVAGFENRGEFGVALIPSGGGFGQYASVFYDRVEGYAERWQASEGMLLGHLMAHEMGHLLLGADSHSRSGIMNVPWSRKKVERASLGTLLFTPSEAKRMQEQAALRIEMTRHSKSKSD